MIKLQKIDKGHYNYILTCITYNPNIGINPPDAYKVATLVRYFAKKKTQACFGKTIASDFSADVDGECFVGCCNFRGVQKNHHKHQTEDRCTQPAE